MTKGLPELLAEAPAEHIPGKEDGIERRVEEYLDTALTLEPDESDHFRIRPTRFAVQPVAGRGRRACDDAPPSVPVLLAIYPGQGGWPKTSCVGTPLVIAAAGVLAQGCRLGQGPLLMFWEMMHGRPSLLGISVMNAERVLSVLDENRDELRRLGVRRLGLFGSTARNKTPKNSRGC